MSTSNPRPGRGSVLVVGGVPFRWNAIWKRGSPEPGAGVVHVSMNDYLIHRLRDIPRVAYEGLRLRRRWPVTEGALGLWMATLRAGRRQVSVSVWREPEDLRRFVRSPEHVRIMRAFRDAGALHTNAWTAERFDPTLIWQQAADRLAGRVDGVPHHTFPPRRRARPADVVDAAVTGRCGR
jgi:hypothetical protein